MKTWKKISTLALAIITVFTISLSVASAATAPQSITVKRTRTMSDLIQNHDYGFVEFQTTNGQIIFCMDNLKDPLETGDKANFVANADAGVQYILEHSYPSVEIMEDETHEQDFYVTQGALWWYLDETGQGSNELDDEFKTGTKNDMYKLLPEMKKLVTAAKQAKNTNTAPKVTISAGSKNLKLTSDKKYYESALISTSVVNASTYKVTADNNALVTDKNGKAKTTFNANEGFKIMVPAKQVEEDENITVNVEASNSSKKAKIFATGNNSKQRVVGLYDEPQVAKINTKLQINAPKYSCEVVDNEFYGIAGNKVDEDTYNKECKKICMVVDDKFYGKDGNVVDEKTYNDECKNVCKVVDDNYYGIDGNIVDKKTFDAECGTVVVAPNTSANIPALPIAAGLLLVAFGSGLIVYRTKKSLI